MPFDRVAAFCAAALIVASLCALNGAAEPENSGADHPFALPDSLLESDMPALAIPSPQHQAVKQTDARSGKTESQRSIAKLIQATPVRVNSPQQQASTARTSSSHSAPSGQLKWKSPQELRESTARWSGPTRPSMHRTRTTDSSRASTRTNQPVTMAFSDRGQTSSRRVIRTDGTRSVQEPNVRRSPNTGNVRLVADEQIVAEQPGVLVPVSSAPADEAVELSGQNGLVFLRTDGAELRSVLRMIAESHGLNLVVGPEIKGPVTVTIRDARLEEVLDAILGVAGYSWHQVGNLLYVTDVDAEGMDPRVQGRSVRVYQLDYVAAADVQEVANGLLSPVGNAFISESDPADEMKTRETLVVEDTPAAHRRIAEFIEQIDVPPMQVLIEAHVLQIALGEEEQHGIDLRALLRLRGTQLVFNGVNFTDLSGSDSDLAVTIDGTDLNGIIQLIRRCTNSRTLASPKVSVVNRQEARIQIGQRLPYSVATTTQTTTVESVEFLEVGIVLTVRPVVTEDGNVLMYVLPKVSGGKITPNGFPEEETTEVQTTIMIPDGGGVVIGGLIREENIQSRAVVPYFNKIPVMGHLFKGRSDEIRRNELVVALVAHVIHNGHGPRLKEVIDLEDALPNHASSELTARPGMSGEVTIR